jgi:nicotinamidase-related amidase
MLFSCWRDTNLVSSDCVLSTARWAADMGYNLVVSSDACAERDFEVHRMLMEKVLPHQEAIMTAGASARAIAEA